MRAPCKKSGHPRSTVQEARYAFSRARGCTCGSGSRRLVPLRKRRSAPSPVSSRTPPGRRFPGDDSNHQHEEPRRSLVCRTRTGAFTFDRVPVAELRRQGHAHRFPAIHDSRHGCRRRRRLGLTSSCEPGGVTETVSVTAEIASGRRTRGGAIDSRCASPAHRLPLPARLRRRRCGSMPDGRVGREVRSANSTPRPTIASTTTPFRRVADDPLSTFSIDVDTASYANVRRFLNGGSLPPRMRSGSRS